MQFRPGAELSQQIRGFAAHQSLEVNECCKRLLALALGGMDLRFYPLIAEMAEADGGRHAFVRACMDINAALAGGLRARPTPFAEEERVLFIFQWVQDALRGRGREVQSHGPWEPILAQMAATQTPTSTLGGIKKARRNFNLEAMQRGE